MATVVPHSTEQRSVLLADIDWETYERIVDAFGDRRLRHTYVDGMLEIMSPLNRHEWIKKLLGRMVEMISWRLKVPIKSAGSTTLRKKLAQRGLEPDESYYVQNEARVRHKLEIDLRSDPAPDLAIEVDVTHRSLDRLETYAKLGVNEIWVHDGESLVFYALQPQGDYTEIAVSAAFPQVTPADLQRHLDLLATLDENSVLDALVEWIDSLPK